MGQKEEGIGAWKKEWHGIAVPKGFYPYESQNLSKTPPDERDFASTICVLIIKETPNRNGNK
jgi:hypothetical protein